MAGPAAAAAFFYFRSRVAVKHLEQFEPPVAGGLTPAPLSLPKAGVNAPGYNSGNCAASGKSSGAKRTPTPSRRTVFAGAAESFRKQSAIFA